MPERRLHPRAVSGYRPAQDQDHQGGPEQARKAQVQFKFTSDEPNSTFECKIDKKPYKPCTSPRKVKRLDEGKHKFKVIATDEAGRRPLGGQGKPKVVD